MSRYNLRLGSSTSIQPRVGAGGRGGGNVLNAPHAQMYLRFYWNTPILLSPHNPNTLWFGGNRLFRSDSRGDSYVASPDLTKQMDRCKIAVMGVPDTVAQLSKNDGLTAYSTIISVSESPVARGTVWAGTWGGGLSRFDGKNWKHYTVAEGLPGNHVFMLNLDAQGALWIGTNKIGRAHV